MYTKDIERVIRGFVTQKLDIEYIRHYLMENYQLDRKAADQILEKVSGKITGLQPAKGAKAEAGKAAEKKVDRTKFY